MVSVTAQVGKNTVKAYEQWANSFFGTTPEQTGANNSLLNLEKLGDIIVDEYFGVSEGIDLEAILTENTHYEKELTANDLTVLKELDVIISKDELIQIYYLARTEEYKVYKDWRDHVLAEVLQIGGKLSTKENNEMFQLYNRLNSSIQTNQNVSNVELKRQKAFRDSVIAGIATKAISHRNQRTNIRTVKVKGRENPDGTGRMIKKLVVSIKGPKNPITKKSNKEFDKRFLIEFNEENGVLDLFHWINGEDVVEPDFYKKDGRVIKKNGKPIEIENTSYNFLSFEELQDLENVIRKEFGRTLAFPKGDSESIATVEIKKEHIDNAKNAKVYWNKELKNGYLRDERQIKELIEGSEMDLASNIAVHEAMKLVYPKYMGDNATNVYKRMKIPFSKVTVSKSMPSFRIDKFDFDNVLFQYKDNEPFDPVLDEEGLQGTYIGDGNSLTSHELFELFTVHHGVSNGEAKAKTVIYERKGDKTLAIKHEHVLPRKGFKILDKATGEVLYTVGENRNIRDSKGNTVHMLATTDEIKIGNMFQDKSGNDIKNEDGYVTFNATGQSLGFIKYDEKIKNEIPQILQWFNYVHDPEVIGTFMDVQIPKIKEQLKNVFRIAEDRGDKLAADEIFKLLKRKDTAKEGFMPHILGLAELGGSLHPSMSTMIDKIIQTQIINPAMRLSKTKGSIYDISMDMTGSLGRREVALSSENSEMILQKYAEANKNMSLDDAKEYFKRFPERINKWLRENDVKVWITRSPVPHVSGGYIATVRELHGRKSISDLNPIDVKELLEGDGDGDKIHVEMLTPQTLKSYEKFMKDKTINALNLKHFVKDISAKITSPLARMKLMSELTFGAKSVGEIANVAAVYGDLTKIYTGFQLDGKLNVFLKQPNEIVKTDIYHKTSPNKKWEGTVEELLRLYLQAAVDNGKYNLLSSWDYSQKTLAMQLFKNQDGSDISESDYINYLKPLFKKHREAIDIRVGRTFSGKKLTTKELINLSKNYLTYVTNRSSFLSQHKVVPLMSNKALSPSEQIAIMPARIYNEWYSKERIGKDGKKYSLFGQDGTPYILSEGAHLNAHFNTLEEIEANMENILEWYRRNTIDTDGRNLTHKDKKDRRVEELNKGLEYKNDMLAAYEEIILNYLEVGELNMDRTPLLTEWTEKYDKKFRKLSPYAQAVATYEFIRGYENFRKSVTMNRGESLSPGFPPVNKHPDKELSLLDFRIVQNYFKRYNNNIQNERKSDDSEEYAPTLQSFYSYTVAKTKKNCKG